jgi:hypothetical protein
MSATKTETAEPTTTEKALTIHPKVTGAVVAGILAHWIVALVGHWTSLDISSADESSITLVLVFIGGWLAPSRSAALPPPTDS